ncbi:MBL fold metallo-hydrolase [Clostridium cochlearium]|uniref:7,8-dihydropterin-6-yl-methyl-4-(Beta-D-ribofuranosyl)aminobenzene 5'-phosphate synthase n=1 Tax=Clostridium cochlearium TaxID=1494 RepID=A0ABY0QMY4_CLOCO|nr:MBL fold metallo-hydrolase [Clostridium cochlearium]MBV1819238.1 MBL fold metallo-hydrolase [Bacteroidales bacterium MSK.15.36]NSJ91323.1 MBL fold metallo-hydrolase [Coprococcus sp. MSK.21.13]MCG4572233.1 MBL fold metallo-hydrolase [Clostridium cochlearium]MCG4579343.1 MBL fold metallo-hydrolase [Clostridium cochlearium]MCR1971092.1 MBL fold metallo-hydrolase [Clostridium cochlearium]
MKVVTLIENTSKDNDLFKEHGLSLYIEKGNKKILMDIGKSNKVIENAKKLNVDIEDIDMVILSHGHYDHGGGLLDFLKINRKAKVYLKKETKQDMYSCYGENKRYIGLDKSIFEDYSHRLIFIDKFTEIYKDVFIITDIKKEDTMPQGNQSLYIKNGETYENDNFQHELILAIREEEGIVIFTGCAHSGILNMIKTVKKIFQEEKIKAIVGGFHLMIMSLDRNVSYDNQQIKRIAEKILEEDIEKVYTGHCTGEQGYIYLKTILEDKIDYIYTGKKIYL